MPFVSPTFAFTVNIWRRTVSRLAAPSVVSQGTLSQGRRSFTIMSAASNGPAFGRSGMLFSELMLPKLTDIRPMNLTAVREEDLVEVPSGSGRYYAVVWVDDVGKGFSNEYRLALLVKIDAYTLTLLANTWGAIVWPVPIP